MLLQFMPADRSHNFAAAGRHGANSFKSMAPAAPADTARNRIATTDLIMFPSCGLTLVRRPAPTPGTNPDRQDKRPVNRQNRPELWQRIDTGKIYLFRRDFVGEA